ncbi:MAG: UDP-N-acetylmuramate--L-alanine ligase, partial [Chloroflexota bacterium]|nr:UDP-N-acetylmuramate--L-alanine ligase [Chloroflexota bacterium]
MNAGHGLANETRSPAFRSGASGVTLPTMPGVGQRVHFIGIGGIGMSGLARILAARGRVVTGSDAVASDQTAALTADGIAVAIGHGGEASRWAAAADLVVMTAAVRADNPEVKAAGEAGVPVIKRAELLGLLANDRRSIAVAGSHGKSTTSGMLVAALRALKLDPTYAIGAVLGLTGTNAAPGDGETMVVEADEYDRSFLHLQPAIAIITNLDFDHPDIFPDQDAYDAAFARFVGNVPPDGGLVIGGDDPGCCRLRARPDFVAPSRVVTFGVNADADWRLQGDEGAWWVGDPSGREVRLTLGVPGEHNARNATAALAALSLLDLNPMAIVEGLATFTGVGRRFEIKGEQGDVLVVDDYAHHPTEVAATLRAARARYPERRIWAIFQPHTFSRLKSLLPEFGGAFGQADRVMLLDVYAAREKDDLGVNADDLARLLGRETKRAANPSAAADRLATMVSAGDLVITLGAGDVTATGPALLKLLAPDPAITAPTAGSASSDRRQPAPNRSPPNAAPCAIRATRASRRETEASTLTIPERPALKVRVDSPMSLHTTWRVGGPADFLVRAPTADDLRAAVAWGHEQGMPVTVIGGGSNLLVGDGGIRGLVILARTPGERAGGLLQVEDLGDAVRVTIGAQAPLSWSGRYAAERGWAGLDWGVGLPGTIGGATVNNAGAHGTEQKDHL